MSSKLVEAVEQWDETLQLDDAQRKALTKQTREELGDRFGLDYNESGMLWYVIHGDMERTKYCAYAVEDKDSKTFLEAVQEPVHQSFEGPWTDYDRIVIRAYLADIAYATSQMK